MQTREVDTILEARQGYDVHNCSSPSREHKRDAETQDAKRGRVTVVM